MPLLLALLVFTAEPDAGSKPLTVAEQAEIQERLRQLDKRCGKDAYRIDVGMSFERVKSCAETTFEIDPKAKSG